MQSKAARNGAVSEGRAILPGLPYCFVFLQFFVWLFVSTLPAYSRADGNIHLIVSESARYYQQVADAILGHLEAGYPEKQVTQHHAGDLATFNPEKNALLICIGTSASTRAAHHFPLQPQLNLFITEEAWKNLAPPTASKQIANLYIDQPIERLVALARAVAPSAEIYASVLGPVSIKSREQLAAAAADAGVALRTASITADSNPVTVLTPLMENAELFVAIPDNSVINRNIAKWALYLAFKHKIPVIGFSETYTNAGATASIFTSTENIGLQATEWLDRFFSEPRFDDWRSHPPKYFTISINPSVMRGLGLKRWRIEQLHDDVLQRLQEPSR